jgi:hypothetical protein
VRGCDSVLSWWASLSIMASGMLLRSWRSHRRQTCGRHSRLRPSPGTSTSHPPLLWPCLSPLLDSEIPISTLSRITYEYGSHSSVRPWVCVKHNSTHNCTHNSTHNSTHNFSSSPYTSFSSIRIISSVLVLLVLPGEATIMLLWEEEYPSMLQLLDRRLSLLSSWGLMVVNVHPDMKNVSADL